MKHLRILLATFACCAFFQSVSCSSAEAGKEVDQASEPERDLKISSFSSNLNSLQVGEVLMFSAIVEHASPSKGDEDLTIHYFKSSDAQISSDGSDGEPVLSENGSLSEFEADSLAIVSTSVLTTNVETVFYGACVESSFEESNTQNNCSEGVQVTVVAVPVTRPIYMWTTGRSFNGNIRDRSIADRYCSIDSNLSLLPAGEDYEHKAVLAYSDDLPHNFVIPNKDSRELQRPDGTKIADHYGLFFDASYSLEASISDTEVSYWTGLSSTDPQVAMSNACKRSSSNWTSSSISELASWGSSTATDSGRYWGATYPQSCNAELKILCISY